MEKNSSEQETSLREISAEIFEEVPACSIMELVGQYLK